jgi:hypothetical protein
VNAFFDLNAVPKLSRRRARDLQRSLEPYREFDACLAVILRAYESPDVAYAPDDFGVSAMFLQETIPGVWEVKRQNP